MRNSKLGTAVLIGLGLASIPYNLIRHPVKSYRLVIHRDSWY